MFVFAIWRVLSSNLQKSEAFVPLKYDACMDVFDKAKANVLLEHQPVCNTNIYFGSSIGWEHPQWKECENVQKYLVMKFTRFKLQKNKRHVCFPFLR